MIEGVLVARLLYFMLPAYVANMAPVLGRWFLKSLAVPIDGGRSWDGRRLLGDHKTWRGLLFGVVGGIGTAFLQSRWTPEGLAIIDYAQWLPLGFLLGFGALFGDALKSFVKRRMDIDPGERWIPFDQLDFVVGSLAFTSVVYFPGWIGCIIIAVVTFVLSIVVNEAAYRLGIRGSRW